MFHPAAALRRADLRPVIEADFRRIPALLDEARRARLEAPAAPAGAAAAAGPSEQRSLL